MNYKYYTIVILGLLAFSACEKDDIDIPATDNEVNQWIEQTMRENYLYTVGTRIVWIFGIFPSHRSLKILFVSYPASWMLTILMQAVCFYFVRKKVHRELKQQTVFENDR